MSCRAPLYTDAFELARWLAKHFADDPRPLARRICHTSLDLLEAVTLALGRQQREERVEQADESLAKLRTQLRLAAELGALSDRQLLHALGLADTIGRQLGGWLRSMGPV